MSIEIEVGLENAARVPRAREELFLAEPPKGIRKSESAAVADVAAELWCWR